MDLEGREKLAEIINNLIEKYGSVRAVGKRLGVSHTTVTGWQKMTSTPDPENLKRIAHEAGFNVYELQKILDQAKYQPAITNVDRVIYEIQQLNNGDIAKVIEAAARYMGRQLTEA